MNGRMCKRINKAIFKNPKILLLLRSYYNNTEDMNLKQIKKKVRKLYQRGLIGKELLNV